MTREEFIQRVSSEIIEGGSLPVKLLPERVKDILDQSKRFFYRACDDAKQTEYMIIGRKIMDSPEYRAKRTIKLPDCVWGISELRECGADWVNYNINPDYKKVNYSYLNGALTGDSGSMVYSVAQAMYFDFIRTNFVVKTVAFSYNQFSKTLKIEGRSEVMDMAASARIALPETALFEMDLFFDYVVGMCRKSIGRIYSTSDLKLMGRSGFDISSIKEDGKEAVADIKSEFKAFDESDVAFMLIDGRSISE
jgi:hypothetical protein